MRDGDHREDASLNKRVLIKKKSAKKKLEEEILEDLLRLLQKGEGV